MKPCPSPLQTLERSTFTNTKLNQKELHAVVMKWLWLPDVPKVFVTLRAHDWGRIKGKLYPLTAKELSQTVWVFMERLSRPYFSVREVARGKRLRHAFACEAGDLVGLHYHGWIEIPEKETGDFCEIVETAWNGLAFADNAVVKPAWSDGALSYSIKWKSTGHFLDHIDLRNTSLT